MKPWMKELNTDGWYVKKNPVTKDIKSKEVLEEPRRHTYATRDRLPPVENIGEALQIWKFISDYIDNNGFPPSMRDTGKNFHLEQASVRRRMQYLEKKGYIRLVPNISRGVVILIRPDDNLEEVS